MNKILTLIALLATFFATEASFAQAKKATKKKTTATKSKPNTQKGKKVVATPKSVSPVKATQPTNTPAPSAAAPSEVKLPTPSPALALEVDSVVVFKTARQLHAYGNGGKRVLSFAITLGGFPRGPKVCNNDGKTPEGNYLITSSDKDYKYYKALIYDYPQPVDLMRSEAQGCKPGLNGFIHGTGDLYADAHEHGEDWTDGSISIKDNELDLLLDKISFPCKLKIKP